MDNTFSLLDKHFSKFLVTRAEIPEPIEEQFRDIVLRLTAAMEKGSSCIALSDIERSVLLQSRLVTETTQVNIVPQTVLVIFDNKLYLQRYFIYEARLATQLKHLALTENNEDFDEKLAESLFPEVLAEGEINYQRLAAEKSINSSFLIISGGPGTGKTTTTVRLLTLLMHSMSKELKIALCAPTGKAAQRLFESIKKGIGDLPEEQQLETAKWLPQSAMTLHRLLGYKRNSIHFNHNSENPLSYDLIVVDEASMVDLAMMSKLVDALKAGSRLLLLGDKDQLTSVESGTVLSAVLHGLPDCSVQLQKTYRFKNNIRKVADAVKSGDVRTVASCIDSYLLNDDWHNLIKEKYNNYLKIATGARVEDISKLFAEFKAFMVLCSTRKGRRGVQGINVLIEDHLKETGVLSIAEKWYSGRPVIVNRNDYDLGLYNGDIGICVRDNAGRLRVYFEDGDSFKSFPTAPLHSCETVYAMTIHKSQGSEFNNVIVVLPEADSRVLSRELLYTGITRAKESVMIVGDKSIVETAVDRVNQRGSGLTRMLTSL